MCGIAAIFAYSGAIPDPSTLARASERMSCRGPDGRGSWASPDGRVQLAHRRLAIIDLSPAGAQPMRNADGSVVISFNGEIYNYRQLRDALVKKGRKFRSESDTEVMLHLYDEMGTAMFQELRGMYAISLWDDRAKCLVLGRDPFGIKPLYLADTGSALYAGSEVKSIAHAPGVNLTPEAAGHVGYFLWGHVPEPFTMYRGIRALEPGTCLIVGADGSRTTERFASVPDLLRAADAIDGNVSSDDLHDDLLDSVRHHLVADVPVGIFLSAGIDSAVLASLARETGADVRTVTLGFEEFRGTPSDETDLAGVVAERYGATHETVWVTQRDFALALDRILDRMDQPTIDGVNSYFVARAASHAGLKVALSGLGGDELFGGYPSFTEVPRLVDAVSRLPAAHAMGRLARVFSAPLIGAITSPKYAGLIEYGNSYARAFQLRRGLFMPWELDAVLDRDFVRSGLGTLDYEGHVARELAGVSTPRLRISGLEAGWYMRNQLLRDTDWASMSHSIEVRVPFVDWRLWRATLGGLARTAPGKELLAAVARPGLPRELTARVKTGFHTPVARWLDQELGARSGQRGLRSWARYVYSRSFGGTMAGA